MANEKRTLPDGCYEIEILGAYIELNKNNKGYRLKIFYEVIGPEEYSGYFDSEFRNQNTEDNHWHGSFYVSLPDQGDGHSSSYGLKKYKEFMQVLRKSNPEYVNDHKLSSFRGLHLGAYIETRSYTRTNGSICKIKAVTQVCSVDEYELLRCDDILPFDLEDEADERPDEFSPKGGDFHDWL